MKKLFFLLFIAFFLPFSEIDAALISEQDRTESADTVFKKDEDSSFEMNEQRKFTDNLEKMAVFSEEESFQQATGAIINYALSLTGLIVLILTLIGVPVGIILIIVGAIKRSDEKKKLPQNQWPKKIHILIKLGIWFIATPIVLILLVIIAYAIINVLIRI